MSTRKLWSVVFSVVVGCAVLLPAANATEEDQKTQVTFNQPIEIPGHVLAAGTYLFVVAPTADRDVVLIYGSDGKTLYAMERTVAAYRPKPVHSTTFTFAEQGSSQPVVLLQWFFPNQNYGHEFRYPKQEEKDLAKDTQKVVVTTPQGETKTSAGF